MGLVFGYGMATAVLRFKCSEFDFSFDVLRIGYWIPITYSYKRHLKVLSWDKYEGF